MLKPSRSASGPAALLAVMLAATAAVAAPAGTIRQPAELAGTWEFSFDRTHAACRVLLRGERSDKGDYFLGMPSACRHAMPGIAAVGRWSMPDSAHLALGDPGGATLLTMDATGDGFVASGPAGVYTLKPLANAQPVVSAGFTPLEPAAEAAVLPAPTAATPMQALAAPSKPQIERIATRRRAEPVEPVESKEDLAGRYAVMREKRDTGCMLTLDKTRGTGGDRAQLAPGCRDQGIVIFDPSAWQIVKGGIVLTARAGHKTRLEKSAEGQWSKDPKEGGKPLGLKKL